MRHLLNRSAIAGLVVICACAGKTMEYIAPSRLTVRASTEQAHSPRTGFTVYVENTSSAPVIVYSVTLRDCENVRAVCGSPVPINVRIQPGQREVIKRIDRRNEGMEMRYRLSWAWRPESRERVVAAPAGEESEAISAPSAAAALTAVANALNPSDPFMPIAELRALGAAAATLRVEPDSIEMRVGETRSISDFRVALYDTAGVRRGRVPFGIRFPTNKISFAPPTFTAIAPGDAVIEFNLPSGILTGTDAGPGPAHLVVIIRE